MADISKITLPSGSVYNIKDAQARADIAAISGTLAGGVSLLGVTTTPLTDQATTPTTIAINDTDTAVIKGNLVIYNQKEFLWDGTKWQEMGDLGAFKALAYKDTASTTYTPAGTVTQPSFSGSVTTSTGTFTPAGSVSAATTSNQTPTVAPAASGEATYTPAGSVAAPTISVDSAGTTTTVNSITDVGTLPAFTTSVTSENLTLGWSAGTLPTKGADTTVKTGDASYTASAPVFTGTGVRLVTDDIAVPATYTFTGTEGSVSVSGTPTGTVSQPTFSGTEATITVS